MTQSTTKPAIPSTVRQRFLLAFAWGATLLPLVPFVYLSWQVVHLTRLRDDRVREVKEAEAKVAALKAERDDRVREVTEAEAKVAMLKAERADLEAKLAGAQQQVAVAQDQAAKAEEKATLYRTLAGIKIRFYRAEDRDVLQNALAAKGFRLEVGQIAQGNARLLDRKANAIAYGARVAPQDLADIATALVDAGFPLRKIQKATHVPEENLIQIYASAAADTECGLLTIEQIRAGETCGTA